jgi:peptide deformylase
MAVRPIILWPEPWLNQKSDPVLESEFGTEALKEMAIDLADTLKAAKGFGLAAPQLCVHKQVVVVWTPLTGASNTLCLCNPKIVATEGEPKVATEGCLSLPGAFAPVARFPKVTVQYRLVDGTVTEDTFEDHAAVAVQHEMDHLVGTTLADKVGPAKRNQMRDRIKRCGPASEHNRKLMTWGWRLEGSARPLEV